jgi:hypothetical protein
VHDPGAGKGAGVAANAAFHTGCCQDLHGNLLLTVITAANTVLFDTDVRDDA